MKKIQIRVTNMSFGFHDKQIVNNMNYVINKGQRICLLGDNGQGKTTLLKLLTKQLTPDQGGVAIDGDVALLTQGIDKTDQQVYEYLMQFVEPWEEYKIYMAMEDAGCDFSHEQTIAQLSGGQQTRLRLAALFLVHASILVLDEPTNHLDREAVERLVDLIKNYEGIVIIVSHDRWFINQCSTHIMELENTNISYYQGDYESYEKQKQERFERELAAFKLQERKRKKMEQWIHRIRQRASVYDSPALGALLRSKVKQYDRQFAHTDTQKPTLQKNAIRLHSHGGLHAGKLLFACTGFKLAHGDNILCKKVSLEMRGQQRILLSGANGTGKSTFLNVLYQQYQATNAQEKIQKHPQIRIGNDICVAYFQQNDVIQHADMTIIDWYIKHVKAHGLPHQITATLSRIGIEHVHTTKKVSELSYGQRVKLRFLAMTSQSYDVLFLDEPTNHLDIMTREVLETMLNMYQGAIVLVSHDQWFAASIRITDIRTIQDQTIMKEIILS